MVERKPMSRLEQAILTAVIAHQGQIDEDGQPHIVHSLEVMFSVKRAYEEGASILKGYTLETLMVAAVLHDVPEDTSLTLDDIRRDFGKTVAEIVDGVTRRHGDPQCKLFNCQKHGKETYRDFIYRSRENPASCFLKIQDLLVNLGRCHSISPKKAKWRDKLEYKYGIALRVLTALEPVTWEQVSWTFSGDKYSIADPNGKKINITEAEFKKHMGAGA
jgi:guanosine-3',5'-bis(diphosphate) 3'-pyrophosphohydrolase